MIRAAVVQIFSERNTADRGYWSFLLLPRVGEEIVLDHPGGGFETLTVERVEHFPHKDPEPPAGMPDVRIWGRRSRLDADDPEP